MASDLLPKLQGTVDSVEGMERQMSAMWKIRMVRKG